MVNEARATADVAALNHLVRLLCAMPRPYKGEHTDYGESCPTASRTVVVVVRL
jgi:hypothetical protein